MSDEERPSEPLETLPEDAGGLGPESRPQLSLAARYGLSQKAVGILAPFLTVVIAFLVGGVVIVVTTGKSPWNVYKAIFDGAGLNWFLPWISADERTLAALNLQQTLLTTTALILTGLAVAFAFRCGMFNIGGQGQYLVGSIMAIWIGSSLPDMQPFLHVLFAILAGTLMGALWAGIAGLLKATVGAHEVISTIMLNWIAIWVGFFLFGLGGPLQNDTNAATPISNDVVEGAKLPVFWGDPILQGLHIGFFVAIGALVVYWMLLNRTTLGYGVKAVGFNPEAARYGGISVARNYFLAMAISGMFAGLAGAIDIIGYQFQLSTSSIDAMKAGGVGFTGIAVALLGRNTAVGVFFSALLFGALTIGTSTRNLDENVFQPELAGNLAWLIQGLVVLFVGADIIVLTVLNRMGRLRRRRTA